MSGKPAQIQKRQGVFETSWGVALWIIAIAAILFILDFASAILLPTAYAIVLSLVLAPIARGLSRLRIPEGISAVLTVAMAAAGIVVVISVVTPALADHSPATLSAVRDRLAQTGRLSRARNSPGYGRLTGA